MKNIIIILLALLIAGTSNAQIAPPHECGTKGMSPWLQWYQTHKQDFPAKGADTAWLYVPVTVHRLANDGGGGAYPENEIFRMMCDLNSIYEEARIRFYLQPGEMFMKHNMTDWWDHPEYDAATQMIEATFIPGRLNAYIVENAAGNCGYAYYDVIVNSIMCSGPTYTTFAHEIGHHLSLPHTFYGWEGESVNWNQPAPEVVSGWPVEKKDSSNCTSASDGFCDTDPDYLSTRWNCDSNERSGTVQTDPNGVKFTSDGTLLMSYSDQICRRRFSPDQIAAMRANLHSEHLDYLLNSVENGPVDDNAIVQLISPIDSAIQQYNDITLTWTPVPNATFYLVEVALTSSFSVQFYNEFVYNATSINITSGIPNNKRLFWRVRPYNEWDLCKPLGTPPMEVFFTRTSVGINDLERVMEAKVIPNPTVSGTPIVLSVDALDACDAQIQILDATGKLLSTQQVQIQSGENTISLKPLAGRTGVYYLRLLTDAGSLTRRIVVVD